MILLWLASLLLGALAPAPARAALELLIDENGAGPGQEFFTPYSIAWDPVGGRVIVPSYDNSMVFAITAIGPGVYGKSVLIDSTGDGINPLAGPWGVAVGPDGTVYVSGNDSHNVFSITQGGTITQIADTTGAGPSADLLSPRDIAVSPTTGNVYVSGHVSNNVFEILPGGGIIEIVDGLGDGMGNNLSGPLGLAIDLNGNVYVAGHFSHNVLRIDDLGVVTEVIDATGDGLGNALNRPWGLAITSQGDLIVAGHYSNNVLVRGASGTVTEVLDSTGDGSTALSAPVGVATAYGGVSYVASSGNDVVFQIRPLGPPAVAADGTGDGAGNDLIGAWAVDVDDDGDVLVTGVFSWNAFSGAPPDFEPVPILLVPGVGLLAVSMAGAGARRLRRS